MSRSIFNLIHVFNTFLIAIFMSTIVSAAEIKKGDDQTMKQEYRPGILIVKFKKSALYSKNFKISINQTGIAQTGITSIDILNQGAGVIEITKEGLYQPKNKRLAMQAGVARTYVFRVPENTDIKALAEKYKADPNIEFAEPDWRLYPLRVPNDTYYSNQWGHNNTAQMPSYNWNTGKHDGPLVGTVGFDANAQAAWDNTQGYGSSSIVIGIIDTGVDWAHPDLRIWQNTDEIPENGKDDDNNGMIDDIRGWDFGSNDNDPTDNSWWIAGHGTACAGVAAAISNNNLGVAGVAGGCTIMPLKVANKLGLIYSTAINNALYYGADNGAKVLSMSLGGDPYSQTQQDACNYAWSTGAVVLAATGNENDKVISYPAAYTNVIAVGAASNCDGRKRSSSDSQEAKAVNKNVLTDPNGCTCDGEGYWGSNYGLSASKDSPDAVDVIAPTILPTTDISGAGGYDPGDYSMYYFNGTSCSTPYAAGVCSLIFSKNPTWTPTQVRNQLVNTAQDIVNVESAAGWDVYSGYGLVDASAAVGSGNKPPNRPSNLEPSDGATNVSLTPTLKASAFSDPDAGDYHLKTWWDVRIDDGKYDGMGTPVWDSGWRTYDLTSTTVPSGLLEYNTRYRWRVRYMDNHEAISQPIPVATKFTTISNTNYTRIIHLEGDLNFGEVPVGSNRQLTMTIYNDGNSTLTVSSIKYPTDFGGYWNSGAIAAHSSQQVIIFFVPEEAKVYSGDITVTSDATSGTNTKYASGTGTISPHTVTAKIDSVSPNPAKQGITVNFSGTGSDSSGHSITTYKWHSSIDGDIGASDKISKDNLSLGEHYIYFSVKCSNGVWSHEEPWKENPLVITPNCTYDLINGTNTYFDSDGGNGKVDVTTSSSNCSWTAVSNDDWITITDGSNVTGNGAVSYIVSAYTGKSARTGTMTIAKKTFTVIQNGPVPCKYSISPIAQSFSSNGGNGKIDVTTSSSSCSWTAESSADWITITSGSSGTGNGTVSYSVSDYTGTETRTGTMTIAGKPFTIIQSPVSSESVIAEIDVGNHPEGVGVDPETNFIYVANNGSSTVSVINGTTNKVVDTIWLPPVKFSESYPFGVGVNPQTKRIYVTCINDEIVRVINSETNEVIDTVKVGSHPIGIGVNPQTNLIYVANNSSLTVSVINGDTNEVVETIPVGRYPWGIGVNTQTNFIYVANQFDDTVSVINGKTNEVTTVQVEHNPLSVGVNDQTNRIYVTNRGSGTVSVIDGGENKVIAKIVVGSIPEGVGVNTQTNRIYIANTNSDTISVIDGIEDKLVGTIGLEAYSQPRGIGVNAKTERVYVSNDGRNMVSVIGQLPPLPVVVLTSPADGAADVAVNTTITATFNKAMDASTISDATFTINNGTGTVTYDDTTKTATFTPSENLSYATEYTATITTDVKDIAGNSMAANYSWSFTTVPDPTPPDGSIIISDGVGYTTTKDITLNLSAHDTVGVAAYLKSEDSTKPLPSDERWEPVDPTMTNFSKKVSYTLGDVDGEKTVYAWYKDAAGNVSETANDAIVLDTVSPTVTITNPATNPYITLEDKISLDGTAEDVTSGIKSVTWTNDKGGSGTATGTTGWNVSDINLVAGTNTVTIEAVDNAGNPPGSDEITITRCTYTLSSEKASFGSQGGEGSFEITTASESCCWSAKSEGDWIKIKSVNSACGGGKIDYAVNKNETTEGRDGSITITDTTFNKVVGTFAIHQDGVMPCDNDNNDDFDVADDSLILGEKKEGKICSSTDRDFYKIRVRMSGVISFELDVPQDKNYDLFLYNSAKKLIDSSKNGKGLPEKVDYSAKSPDTYYIRVVGNSQDDYDVDQMYTLSGTWPNWEIDVVKEARPLFNFYPKAIDVGVKNHVHIVFGGNHLYYAHFDGKEWHYETVDKASGVGGFASIRSDKKQKGHVSYYDRKNKRLKYASNTSGSWKPEVVDGGDGIAVGTFSSIVFDSSNNVHMCYYDIGNKDLKYATKDESGNWKFETVDSDGDVGMYACMKGDKSGKLHISYYDESNGDLKYAFKDESGTWKVETVDSAGDVGKYTSLAVDEDGAVHISYYDETNGVLKYINNVSGEWKGGVVDNTGNVGKYSSIMARSGMVHISYYDETNKDLKYASRITGSDSWKTEVVDSNGSVGMYTSMDLDSMGKPHISYLFVDGKKRYVKHATNAD